MSKREEFAKGDSILYIIRGVTGSGKTTLATELAGSNGVILSTDEFFYTEKGYKFDPKRLSEAHQWNQGRAFVAMAANLSPIVIDNNNLQVWEARPYILKAKEHNYKVEIREPQTPWKKNAEELAKKTSRGLSVEVIRKMLEKLENYTVEDALHENRPPQPKPEPQHQASSASQVPPAEVTRLRELEKKNQNSSLILYILRGISGSGKSTLSAKLVGSDGVVLSTDEFFIASDGIYKFDIKKLGDAHKWNQERAFNAMDAQISPIVVDNTNLQAWEPRPYVVRALEKGYKIEIVEPDTPWKKDPVELAKRNTHGVNAETIAKMLDRWQQYTVDDIIIAAPPDFSRRAPPQQQQVPPRSQAPPGQLNEQSPLLLYILRGISGSGKSTLAAQLAGKHGVVFSADAFFMTPDGVYQFDSRRLEDAHQWNQERSFAAMKSKKSPIVIDNTNLRAWEAKPYVVKGLENGYKVEIVEPNTPWKKDPVQLAKKNTHGVPVEVIMKMLERWENYTVEDALNARAPGQTAPSQVASAPPPQIPQPQRTKPTVPKNVFELLNTDQ